MADELLHDTRQDVLWLTLNRPEVHNALNAAMTEALTDAIRAASGDGSLRAVVITAAGDRSFCSGADLKESAGGMFLSRNGTNLIADVMRAIESCDKPVIARINGRVLAGGLGLVATCDLAYAADHAEFGLPEVRIGLFPAMVAAKLLAKIPLGGLQEMAYLGQPITAAEAKGLGLVNRTAPLAELDGLIEEVLAKLRQNAPGAVAAGKAALLAMRDMPSDERLAFAEGAIAAISGSNEAREGRQAFAEKRPPKWIRRS
ncbi:enoyl-CoA hydratase [Agrobacterium sp. ATCC 31749]|jgi:enoyl-CoA hydratase/carnithine racemase|uniref:enoyl-CoA hydratase-related protein n=1 Tax=Agrobacterium TaxID=357 RepID=UPI00020DB630|nr:MULTISPECIES: enoyl-CoA hydratase-related protein [Agrobacterium]EGL62812.1 enoyl-CoA hydratase [Agrobacterium sp. ATCC 31749]QKW99720.1 enoyl-CoA hydratase [Agrobacterium sp. CGMCC 11546]UXT59315.1 enoyl-CoA hydratase [Agrobacterium fabrum]CAH0131460.1 1,4-dihydroxy-2-naphthoyl-CoA synthase [Agrobacterium fabrum]CAH0178401.1 1,4-dihydroxy-2-naphthoyl-CoA synthase [Agrobacterium fabrum]